MSNQIDVMPWIYGIKFVCYSFTCHKDALTLLLIDLAVYRSMPFVVVVIVRTYDCVFLSPSILESIGFHTNRSIAYVTMQDKYTQTKSEKRAKRYQLYSLHTHIRTKAAEHKTIVYCRLK